MLTISRLKQLLSYDADTGEFTRIVDCGNRKAGEIAGADSHGYVVIRIDRKNYLAHRLAWFYCTGVWAVATIDHKNGIRNDNRLDNLREAEHTLNNANQLKASGVNILPSGKYNPFIRIAGRNHNLGVCSSKRDALRMYQFARHYVHGRQIPIVGFDYDEQFMQAVIKKVHKVITARLFGVRVDSEFMRSL